MSLPTPYYEQDGITIYHGDCREILPHLPKVDLVLTSPPYDDLRDYGGHGFDWQSTIDAIVPSIKEGGVCVWIVGDATRGGSETGTSFRQALFFMEKGFNLHDTMIYLKDACPFPEINRYYPSFEFMFVFSKGTPRVVNLIQDKMNVRFGEKVASSTQREKDGKTRKVSANKKDPNRIIGNYGIRQNVWLYSPGYLKSTKDLCAYNHPAIFPESLAHDHIYTWSDSESIVLDPMCGSGTTLKRAKQLGRKAIGIEIEEKYCQIAVKRLSQGVLPL